MTPTYFIHQGRLLGLGNPVINWRLPLASSLLACYVPSAFPRGPIISNLAAPGNGNLDTFTTGVASRIFTAPTPEGWGISVQSGNPATITGSAPTQWQLTSGVSLFYRGQYLAKPINTESVVFLGLTCASSPFFSYVITGGGAGGTTGQLGVAYNTSSILYNGTIVPVVNSMYSAAATFAAGGPAKLFVNGTQDTLSGSPPNVALLYTGGAVKVNFGNVSSTQVFGTTFTVGYIWGRILTPGEISYLDANPYALLLWPSDVAFAMSEGLPTPQAAVTPTSAPQRAFFSPLAIGLGGAAAASRIIRRNPLVTRRRLLRPWE
jgi:hypothetical protein